MAVTTAKVPIPPVDDLNKIAHAANCAPRTIPGVHELAEGGAKERAVWAFLPEARAAWVVGLTRGEPGIRIPMERIHPDGFYSAVVPAGADPFPYRLAIENHEGHAWEFVDPYQF